MRSACDRSIVLEGSQWEAVRTWNERYRQRAWVRQLEGAIERPHEDRLMEVIERFDGRPFPVPSRRPASWYDPGRFWSDDRIELIAPFALGGEIAVH